LKLHLTAFVLAVTAVKLFAAPVNITYPCSDDTDQPAAIITNTTATAKPLLVALHTWSSTYTQRSATLENWCAARNWTYIRPNYRGANNTSSACGSERAILDIVDAVTYCKSIAAVDNNRVYLYGLSGGGHMALLCAGRLRNTFTAITAWCGITDLAAWYDQCKGTEYLYWQDLESVCGGTPLQYPAEYASRSPMTYVNQVVCPVQINTGINDGYTGSVPTSHTLLWWNARVPESLRFSTEQVSSIVDSRTIPDGLGVTVQSPAWGGKLLMRRGYGPSEINVFNGTHEAIDAAALEWLNSQRTRSGTVYIIR
jgi:hypothetical protein